MAGGIGFEPIFTESESVVLPLNDPPVKNGVPRPKGRVFLILSPTLWVKRQFYWWRCRDLNPGHYGYEPYALTR